MKYSNLVTYCYIFPFIFMANIDENTTKTIKEELERKVVPKLQKEIEKEVTAKFKTKDPKEILSGLDSNVKDQLEQLTENSQPVIPKNQLDNSNNNEVDNRKPDNQAGLNNQIQKEAELNKAKKVSANALSKKTGISSNIPGENIKPLPANLPIENNETKNKTDNTDESSENKSTSETQANDLNLQKRAKIKNDGQSKINLKGKIAEKVDSIQLFTNQLLKKSILASFATWGLSLFYTYTHVFLHFIFPKYFCSLGQEWVPANIQKVGPEEAKKMGNKFGVAEKPGVAFAFLLQLFGLVLVITVIYFIIHPKLVAWEFLKDFVKKILGIKYE